MLTTYWQLSSRLLDEEDSGYTNTSASGSFMHSHTHHHHQFSHQNYPINYSRSGGILVDISEMEAGGIKAIKQENNPHSILRTPQPKISAKNIFNDSDNNEVIIITKNEATKLADLSASYYHQQYRIHDGDISASSTSSSNDYKSLQISPLDFSQVTNKNIY